MLHAGGWEHKKACLECGMKIKTRSARRSHGRRDLTGDEPGLSHSGEDHAPFAIRHPLHGFFEILADPGTEARNSERLDLQDFSSELNNV